MLETERLIIRPFTEEDAAGLFAYLSRPEVFRFEHGGPTSMETARQPAGEWSKGTQFWAVMLKEPPRTLLGHISFMPSSPEHFKTWEIGYIFHPDYHRRGYCTEAARAIISHAFKELGAHRIVAHCSPENPASWKVLEKCGLRQEGLEKKNVYFHHDGDGSPAWLDSYTYAILEEEFFKAGGLR